MAHGLIMQLAGEIAFITGAGRGIGAETARVFARHGAAVVVTARKRVHADTIATEITGGGGSALALSCDVTDVGSVAAAIAVATQELGAPTILVNNAGIIAPLGHLIETNAAEWAANVTINLVGPANAARAVLPAMLAAGRGTIVNLSSGAAHIPIAGWGAYCAAKAGLAMLTKVLAAEYGEKGVRVFGFAPGLVDTEMQGAIRASGIGPVAKLPREKLTSPREPAEAIAFLASSAGDRFAGQELDIRNADFRAAAGLAPLAA
jgi:NAD(P)-dependent dehydrogenase (short-subunit alcohol dehydrogenase family)